MDLKIVLEGVIDFMVANPLSDQVAGVTYLITDHGIAPGDAPGFFSAVGSEVIAVGMVPSPGGWEAIRDKANDLGGVAAKAFIGVIVKAGGLATYPAVQIVTLKKQLSQLQPAIDSYDVKIAVADSVIEDEPNPDVVEILQDGKGVSQAARSGLARTRDMIQAQLDNQIASLP